MKPLFPLALALGAMALTGCAQGNLRTPGSYAALAPPPVRDPWYDPIRRLWLIQRDLAAPRLRPSANDREAGRARLAGLPPRLRGRGMGDGGWRRIDAAAARHFLTRVSAALLGGARAERRLLLGPIRKGGASYGAALFLCESDLSRRRQRGQKPLAAPRYSIAVTLRRIRI